MAKTMSELAESLGVSRRSVYTARKTLAIEGNTLSKEDEERIKEFLKPTSRLKEEAERKLEEKSTGFVANVRRIDKSNDSSIYDMLQDCKEQYVKNEALIQRLHYEVDHQDILMHGNGNGTLSPLPQMTLLEKFQKVNIALRNQILSLEQALNIEADDKEENPFD